MSGKCKTVSVWVVFPRRSGVPASRWGHWFATERAAKIEANVLLAMGAKSAEVFEYVRVGEYVTVPKKRKVKNS